MLRQDLPFYNRQQFLLCHGLQVRILIAKLGGDAAVFPGHWCGPRERRRGRGRSEYRIMKLSGTNLVQYDYWIIRPPDISSQLQSEEEIFGIYSSQNTWIFGETLFLVIKFKIPLIFKNWFPVR